VDLRATVEKPTEASLNIGSVRWPSAVALACGLAWLLSLPGTQPSRLEVAAQELTPASVQGWFSAGGTGTLDPAGSPQSLLASSNCSRVYLDGITTSFTLSLAARRLSSSISPWPVNFDFGIA